MGIGIDNSRLVFRTLYFLLKTASFMARHVQWKNTATNSDVHHIQRDAEDFIRDINGLH